MMGKQNITEKIFTGTDLIREPVPLQPLIEVLGNHRVVIENHCGLNGYSSDEISVKTEGGSIRISGKNLMISCICRCYIVILGEILGVSLTPGEPKK